MNENNGNKIRDYDDKDLVILATFTLGIVAMLILPESKDVVLAIVSGLFGVAVGKATK